LKSNKKPILFLLSICILGGQPNLVRNIRKWKSDYLQKVWEIGFVKMLYINDEEQFDFEYKRKLSGTNSW